MKNSKILFFLNIFLFLFSLNINSMGLINITKIIKYAAIDKSDSKIELKLSELNPEYFQCMQCKKAIKGTSVMRHLKVVHKAKKTYEVTFLDGVVINKTFTKRKLDSTSSSSCLTSTITSKRNRSTEEDNNIRKKISKINNASSITFNIPKDPKPQDNITNFEPVSSSSSSSPSSLSSSSSSNFAYTSSSLSSLLSSSDSSLGTRFSNSLDSQTNNVTSLAMLTSLTSILRPLSSSTSNVSTEGKEKKESEELDSSMLLNLSLASAPKISSSSQYQTINFCNMTDGTTILIREKPIQNLKKTLQILKEKPKYFDGTINFVPPTCDNTLYLNHAQTKTYYIYVYKLIYFSTFSLPFDLPVDKNNIDLKLLGIITFDETSNSFIFTKENIESYKQFGLKVKPGPVNNKTFILKSDTSGHSILVDNLELTS